MPSPDAIAKTEILLADHDQAAAMIAGRTDLLEQILADQYVAVHISGYEQPKAEWLANIDSGQMRYHGIREQSASIVVDGDRAVLTTRNIVDATIYGSRHAWPLESTTTYARIDGSWKPIRSRATTY